MCNGVVSLSKIFRLFIMIRFLGLITGISIVLCGIAYLNWQYPEEKKLIDKSYNVLPRQVDDIHEIHQKTPELKNTEQVVTQELVSLNMETDRINLVVKQWPIWETFSSLNSAQGFTDYVQDKTGLSLSIQSVAAGKYSVMVNYHSENELQQALKKIETLLGTSNNIGERN